MQASAKCTTVAPRANIRTTGNGDSRGPRQLSAIRQPTQRSGAKGSAANQNSQGEAPIPKERPQ
eukprot:10729389-Alexandrium_andersonii.AAC.1